MRVGRAALTVAPALLILALLWPTARPLSGQGDTFQFWYAGHLVASGRSPYDATAWAEAQQFGHVAANVAYGCLDATGPVCTWLYPPHTAWLFAPFGSIGVVAGMAALDAFVLLSLIAGSIACVLVFGPRSDVMRASLLVAVFVSHPFVVDIRAGHFVGLLLIGVALLAQQLRSGRVGGVVLSGLVLALKPHLFLALVPAVAVKLVLARAWQPLAAVGAAIGGFALLSLVLYPEAVQILLERAGPKTGIAWSTTLALAAYWGAWATAVTVAASLLLAWAAVGMDRDIGARSVVAVGAALSLIVAPYAQPYDLLLLVPAIALAARHAEAWSPRSCYVLLAALVLLYGSGSWAAMLGAGSGSKVIHPGVLPVVVLALLALVAVRTRRSAGRQQVRSGA